MLMTMIQRDRLFQIILGRGKLISVTIDKIINLLKAIVSSQAGVAHHRRKRQAHSAVNGAKQ
jgi:hypothetical protein